MPECDWHKIEPKLVFLDEYVDGLYRLKECKRVWVIFGLHHHRGWESRVRPRRAEDDSLVGVFASRASRRPNRLGLTLVDLIDVQGNTVTVTGLDAFDGTPVYDMKNFDADYDA
jgi:tRNA (adenine37-N6)-methyltransferase